MKFKELMKKYHAVPFVIMMLFITAAGIAVKWHGYGTFVAKYGWDLGAAYKYYNIILIFMLIVSAAVFCVTVIKKLPVEKCFAVICIAAGSLFIIFMTPDSPADEDKHMFAVTEISNSIMGIGDTDEPYTALYRKCDADSGFTREISLENYLLMGKKLTDRADGNYVKYETEHFNYTWSAAVMYAPAVLGMIISRLTGAGTVIMYFLCRLFMLIVYTAAGYFAIKKLPSGKTVLALIMLLPSALSRASCISQDGIMNAAAFFFMSYALSFAFSGNRIRAGEAVAAVISGSVMIMGKGGAYMPLLLMLFLIPKEAFGNKVKYPAAVAVSALWALIVFFAANPGLISDLTGIGSEAQTELVWTEEPAYGLKNILFSPLKSIKMILSTAVVYGGQFFAEMISGGFGWLQIYSSPLIVLMSFIPLAALSLSHEGNKIVFTVKQRIITAAGVILSLMLIVLSMWAFWTPASFTYVAGIQGRYFIILLLPVMLMLRNNRFTIKGISEHICLFAAGIIPVITILEMWTKIV